MTDTPTKYKFTVASLLLMEEVGIFPPDHRTELLNGEITDMSPINAPHAYSVSVLNRFFSRELSPDTYFVSVQNPLQLSDHALPQPDLLVAHHRPPPAGAQHIQASEVVVLVEVADSSYRYDRHTKLPEYAAAGVPEYWIVNIAERQIEVYTQPEADYYQQAVIRKRPFTTSLGPELDVASIFAQ